MSASHWLALGGWGGVTAVTFEGTVSVHSFWGVVNHPPHTWLCLVMSSITSVSTWMAPLSWEPSAGSEGWTMFQKITLIKGSDFSCWNELCARLISLMDTNDFIFEVCDKGICWKGFSWCTDNYLFYSYSLEIFLSSFSLFLYSAMQLNLEIPKVRCSRKARKEYLN